MIFLTLFGTTTGLEVLNFPLSNSAVPFKIEDSWIEVSPSHLIIKPGKESYVILRRFVGTQTLTWIGLYRAAKEIGYERQGSFYGSGVWLIDLVVDVKLTVDVLRMMADQIKAKAMNGDSFVKRLADVRGDISPPSQLAALSDNPVKINSGCHPSGETAFINAGANPLEVIDWAQRAASAQFLNRIFIGSQDQSPDAGGRVSTQVFRSLASAIDFTFNRKTSDLQKKVSELDLKVKELHQHNANLQDEYANVRSQIDGVRSELSSAKQQLQEASLNYRKEYARSESLESQLKDLRLTHNAAAVATPNQTGQLQTAAMNPLQGATAQASGQYPRGNQNPGTHLTKDPLKNLAAVPIDQSHFNHSLLMLVGGLIVGAAITSIYFKRSETASPPLKTIEIPVDTSQPNESSSPPNNDFAPATANQPPSVGIPSKSELPQPETPLNDAKAKPEQKRSRHGNNDK